MNNYNDSLGTNALFGVSVLSVAHCKYRDKEDRLSVRNSLSVRTNSFLDKQRFQFRGSFPLMLVRHLTTCNA
jgi:hypothetical protein